MTIKQQEARGWWPAFYTPGGARKVARQAVYFAIFIAGVTGVIALISDTPWLFVDVAIVAVLAVGIWRMSRSASIVLLVYYIGSSIPFLMNGEFRLSTVFLRLIGILIFVNAVRATSAYHTLGGPSST